MKKSDRFPTETTMEMILTGFTLLIATLVWAFIPSPAWGTTCGPADDWACIDGGTGLDDRCDIGQPICIWAICDQDPGHILCTVD